MAAQYDIFQQILALSLLSNRVGKYKGQVSALQAQLQSELAPYVASSGVPAPQPEITSVIGDWSLVWGPVVFQDEASASNVADNAMFVARCQSAVQLDGSTQDTFVVAVAGTASMSTFDWDDEDGGLQNQGAAISGVVDFASFVRDPTTVATPLTEVSSNQAYLSLGTATGVFQLLAMTAPSGAAGAGQSLVEFLGSVDASTGPTLVVTGHSLGGALAPALALYLRQASKASRFSRVQAYPSAGASPGNDIFAALFAECFPAQRSGDAVYQVWNTNLWNTHDVVPQAWNTGSNLDRNLNNVLGIYGRSFPSIQSFVKNALDWSRGSGVTYTPLQGTSFTAPFARSIPAKLVPIVLNVPPKDISGYLLQAGQQHIEAYLQTVFGDVAMPSVEVPLGLGVTQESRLETILYFAKLLQIYLGPAELSELRSELESQPALVKHAS